MKLNMTMAEAINLYNAIFFAINNLKNAPAKLGLRLAYNAKQLKSIAEVFDAARNKAFEQFGEKDENGQIKVENDNVVLADQAGFVAAMKEINEEKFDVDLRDLNSDIFPEQIDAAIVAGLFPIIVEFEEGHA